jgi:hypothetical protein
VVVKTDIGIITIAANITSLGFGFPDAIISAFQSQFAGENDMAQPTGFLANRSITTARYSQLLP